MLSGPSGVGKSTVVRRLRQDHPEVWVSVSVTTRHPRPGEVDGLHYSFVGRDAFAAMVEAGELLEWAEFAGHSYGTPRGPVLQQQARGVPVLLEIDLQGARQVRSTWPGARFIFLAPPSWEELIRRLHGRGTESDEQRTRRLETARAEMAAASEFDEVIVNVEVGRTVVELVDLLGL